MIPDQKAKQEQQSKDLTGNACEETVNLMGLY